MQVNVHGCTDKIKAIKELILYTFYIYIPSQNSAKTEIGVNTAAILKILINKIQIKMSSVLSKFSHGSTK